MTIVTPGYTPPSDRQAELAVLEADHVVTASGWKRLPLRIRDITPRENIHWISEKWFREGEAVLIERYESTPETVPPIVVARRKGKYLILDGHHRWRAAKLAGLESLWVVQVQGPLTHPGFMEKQELWPE